MSFKKFKAWLKFKAHTVNVNQSEGQLYPTHLQSPIQMWKEY